MKPTIRCVMLRNGRVGLSVAKRSTILREEGTLNVLSIENATPAQVEHVRAMGGYVPDGIVRRKDQK